VNAYISGTAIVSPIGSACAPLFTGATQKYSQSAAGFSFYGAFVGGNTAPDAYNEEAVFMADNISSWNGHEIGFVKKLNDNNLYGYIQSGARGVYKLLYLTSGNTGSHTYKVLIPSGNHSQVDFYIDGAYKGSLNSGTGENYYYINYWVAGTSHRVQSGWSSSGENVWFSSVNTY
jgi:hypothetical protein